MGDPMAWHSVLLSQNGNTRATFGFGPSGGITRKDNIVVGPESGSSHIEIERVRVRADTNYLITTFVSGAGAVSFRFWAEEMD
jgi:hypothetical protein